MRKNIKKVKKAGRKVDRLVTGILLGTAIGSVAGLALSPKSGKENRKAVKEKAQEGFKKAHNLLPHQTPTKAPQTNPKRKKGLLRRIFSLFGLG